VEAQALDDDPRLGKAAEDLAIQKLIEEARVEVLAISVLPKASGPKRARPGELIHLDVKKLSQFDRPGHRVTGARARCRNRGAGWDFVHVAVDDATRLAYVEVLADERRDTTTVFWLRPLRWFRSHGICAERVIIDNASAHRSRRFAKAPQSLGIAHVFTRPCTPKTNGKAERFVQTLLRELAYGLAHLKRRPAALA